MNDERGPCDSTQLFDEDALLGDETENAEVASNIEDNEEPIDAPGPFGTEGEDRTAVDAVLVRAATAVQLQQGAVSTPKEVRDMFKVMKKGKMSGPSGCTTEHSYNK